MGFQTSTSLRLSNDISSLLSSSLEHGGLILTEQQLGADFFDLRSGLAGQVLQKFVNYRARLALVVPDPAAHGARFSELAHEHRRHALVRFFASQEDAERWLQDGNPSS